MNLAGKNRLAHETSPYLLQHQNNPVDWYPWGPEALKRAKDEGKPILLSVGYSACHWCHVMAHECFENNEIAALMNEHFINIKVDREERPDLDQVYQNVAQAITRGGGWPLTVFLTPELKPFYGGTYFPPQDKYGRPGFGRLLVALSQAFKSERADIDHNVERLMEVINRMERIETRESHAVFGVAEQTDEEQAFNALKLAFKTILNQLDYQLGGMAGAPKFPQVSAVTFVWRMSFRLRESEPALSRQAAGWVYRTLEEMARGGIFDQVGGGFARYSVDEYWTVPHFEKMLYDNGLLLSLYAEVLLNAPDLDPSLKELFQSVLIKTVDWIEREMTSPNGLFYSALDADSLDESGHSHEGHFYVWREYELKKLLTAEEFAFACEYYGVSPHGNFAEGGSGSTILTHRSALKLDTPELRRLEEGIRKKLLTARAHRARPGLDDKILVSWNGLMISGLVWAGMALKNEVTPRTLKMARRAWDAILELGLGFEGIENALPATIQKDRPKFKAYLDDYAYLIHAGLDLARVSESRSEVDQIYKQVDQWLVRVEHDFKDREHGFYFSAQAGADLIQRPKRITDQAVPSGGALLLKALLVFKNEGVQKELNALWSEVMRSPVFHGEILNTALLFIEGPAWVSPLMHKSHFGFEHAFVDPTTVDPVLNAGITLCWRGSCTRLDLTKAPHWNRLK